MDQWLDWTAFGFLALLTLLDGLRRVPAGALVLRKVLGGKWEAVEVRPGYRMVSWWPPLTVSLVMSPAGGSAETGNGGSLSTEELAGRMRAMKKDVGLIMLLGAISLVSLVAVLPIAMRWWGALGFLAALMMVLIFAVLVAGSSYYSSGKLGLSTRQRFAFALPRLNPFAAPGAGEALLERTLKGAPPLAVARMLMAAPDFERWIRASAYDAVQRIESERGDELVKVVGRRRLEELVAERPSGVAPGSPWCPRCGAEFGATSTGCPACEVELKV